MAVPSDRTFSFGNNDERYLSASEQVRPNGDYDAPQQNTAFPTRDKQDASFRMPPPTELREYNVSPPPPPAHRSPQLAYSQLPQPSDLLPPPNQNSATADYSSRPDPHLHQQFQDNRYRNQHLGYSNSTRTASTTTPGIDNMGESAAGGGIAGIAMGVANTNERESGVEAMRSLDNMSQGGQGLPSERNYNTIGSDTPYVPATPSGFRGLHPQDSYASPAPSTSNPFDDDNRQVSAAPSPGQLTPRPYQSHTSIPTQEYSLQDEFSGNRGPYLDNPYKRVSTAWDPRIRQGDIDPNDIEDDGDDDIGPVPRRRSALGMKTDSSSSGGPAPAAAAAGGGVLGALGGFVGRKNIVGDGARDPSGQYGPVPRSGFEDGGIEKSDWLKRQTSGRSKMRWIIGIIIVILIIGAIVGGVIGGIKGAKSNDNAKDPVQQGQSASDDHHQNGDLDKDSAEIKKLMDNPNLHKVFPGMAYTPFNAQYPECLTNPPSQNNVTRDMAVLSQLTIAVRLYGTDCNQTEMVLHAIDKLGLTDMKVWLGVWLEKNTTTNNRGIEAMNEILTKYGDDPFAGVIMGNEVLFRQDLTEAGLAKILAEVKQNFTTQKIDLPVATSDLGDDWTAELAAEVDIVMSNIHPFFAGVEVDVATGWTWNFWQTKDVVLTASSKKKNIISEVGWPSAGGRSCGAVNCTDEIKSSSVAGIGEMNHFMDDFVCQSLANGTDYFWYVTSVVELRLIKHRVHSSSYLYAFFHLKANIVN